MLVDAITITVKGGRGGNGSASFSREGRYGKGGPDGGNGGNGGSVYFRGTTNLTDLSPFRYKKTVVADDGIAGRSRKYYGKNAEDITVGLPVGTIITDIHTRDTVEIVDTETLILIARGGKGGRGNVEFATAINQAPRIVDEGEPGETRTLKLDLRLIANIGLVGRPNAGKSSLLAALTNATPAIGAYPFTTLEPNIGMLDQYAIADIPGLIEGASSGKGLGTRFLKHVEKTKILVHCIDVTSDDPVQAYEAVHKELQQFNQKLSEKPEFILLTKTDLAASDYVQRVTSVFGKFKRHIFTSSINDPNSLHTIRSALHTYIDQER